MGDAAATPAPKLKADSPVHTAIATLLGTFIRTSAMTSLKRRAPSALRPGVPEPNDHLRRGRSAPSTRLRAGIRAFRLTR